MTEHRLVGHLYDCFKHYTLLHSQQEFLEILYLDYNITFHPTTTAAIMKNDFFTVGDTEYLRMILTERKQEYYKTFRKLIRLLSESQKIDFTRLLINKLNETSDYALKRSPKKSNEWRFYDENSKKWLISYYKDNMLDLADNIYLYLFFSAMKMLPQSFCENRRENGLLYFCVSRENREILMLLKNHFVWQEIEEGVLLNIK